MAADWEINNAALVDMEVALDSCHSRILDSVEGRSTLLITLYAVVYERKYEREKPPG